MPIMICLYFFGTSVFLANAIFNLVIWNKIKMIESPTQNNPLPMSIPDIKNNPTNYDEKTKNNSLSSDDIKLTQQKQKQKLTQQNEIVRIQEDILSRNLPIKIRRENQKVAYYDKLIIEITSELKSIGESDLEKKEELIKEKKKFEELKQQSKEIIDKITNIQALKEREEMALGVEEFLKNL
jgi:hypothetical protein